MTKTKIMIVEDEAIIRKELENSMISMGYEVVAETDSGEDAIVKAEKEKPDIVLMDIQLEGRIDGIEAADIIHSRSKIPTIFVTAYADEDKINRAKLTLPFGYILKPVQERELKVTI